MSAMPNEYSIAIHHYITEQIHLHEKKVKESSIGHNSNEKHYSLGRLNELQWIRDYLAENIDLKEFTYY
jgi:hypothetical protein